ncbi:MAG: Putative Acriflavin resistance protein [Clostridiales bacterium 38_11]|nr:MAG: Putative Acriflavin resistance protein [Clostridiales bacterium 38_11]HBH12228.1 AcrB/AcrD/AcrF family protein [Clostridiales bacterium]
MSFGKISVGKKYLILSMMIAVIIFGLFSMFTLNTQLSPDTNPPMATVMSVYPGALALDVSTDVSKPMEEAFVKLEGITDIKSTSQDNLSIIQLTFDYSTDVDQAAIDIQNTVSSIRSTLPSGLRDPQVLKFSISDQPILTIGIRSDSLDMLNLRQLTENRLLYELQLIEGVAAVNIFGGYQQEVKVSLDKNQIKAYGLTIEQIAATLKTSHIKAPVGTLTYEGTELLLRVEESLMTIEQLENIVISLGDGNTVLLKDVGEIYLGAVEREGAYRLNGEESLALMVTKKADFNTVQVIENVTEKLELLKQEYPNVEMLVATDDSVFTKQMVNNMASSVGMAIFFTMIVIMLFITNISRSLVISISMPMVFLFTLGLMKMFDMDLDLVTLSALILSIGFVVDGAIVVVENISRHQSEGKSISQAAIDGTDEIAMPSIAGATTTLIVLIPLLFIEGFVGEMFRPLSLTLIFAISSSLVVALLMIPLLSVMFDPFKFKKTGKAMSLFSLPFNKMMDSVLEAYLRLSRKVLKHKLRTFLIIMAFMAVSGLFIKNNGMEMLPKFDSGVTFVTIEMKPGTPLEETLNTVSYIEKYLSDAPIVVSYDSRIGYEEGNFQKGDFGIMGTDQAMITVNLTSRKEREDTIWEFQDQLRTYIEDIPDINRYAVKEKGGTAVTSASAPLAIQVSGEDLNVLYSLADIAKEKITQIDGTTNIYTSYNNSYVQMSVKLDQDRMKELGLSSASVASQLYGRVEGIEVGTMTVSASELMNIRVGYEEKNATNLEDLLNTDLTTPIGIKIPLKEIGEVYTDYRANLVERDNLTYTVKILGFTEERAFSHVVDDVEKAMEEIELPRGYRIEFTGEQEALTDSMGDMVFLISLAIIFVYLLLVPQFKSFIHPLTIMAAIPLILIGIAPALGITGKFMSMPVLLGIILLAGTVVNNAILLVDAISEGMKRGNGLNQSIEDAIRFRYRPIMMTALSDVVGMMPLALQLALGSERFSPLAITVIGGILAATLLTIIVIPMLYATFENLKRVDVKQ